MCKELSIYIHIPFCVQKCAYCDFLSFPAGKETMRAYVTALCREIAQCSYDTDLYKIVSVYIGGGTPSILPGEWIAEVLEAVRKRFFSTSCETSSDEKALKDKAPLSAGAKTGMECAEITIEANPGTLTEDKLKLYRYRGINRLSIGLQSAHNEELALLGRIHTAEQFAESVAMAKNAGFANISVDLMSGLPGQTLAGWQDTLEKVTAFGPTHISAYGLIVEEGTPFYARYHADDVRRERGDAPRLLPDEDTERAMYALTRRLLHEKGYAQYEISNYSLPGWESRHNIGYWTRRPYLGFGLGASSLFEETRWKNTDDLQAYLLGETREAATLEVLDRKDAVSELMFLGLRMNAGVQKETFTRLAGCTMEELYAASIRKLQDEGLLIETDRAVFLTEKGMDLSNYCMRQFLI